MTTRVSEIRVQEAARLVPPRPLTTAEEAYFGLRLRWGKRLQWFIVLGLLGGIVINAVDQIWGSRDTATDIFTAVLLSVLLLPTLWLIRLARARPTVSRRVGRYAGLHTLAGLPVTHLIGPYTVQLPDRWNGPPVFALDQVVDVEFTPALEDDPDPGHGRLVLSVIDADGRRVRAVDPALVATPAA